MSTTSGVVAQGMDVIPGYAEKHQYFGHFGVQGTSTASQIGTDKWNTNCTAIWK